jgi:hypothetical protein
LGDRRDDLLGLSPSRDPAMTALPPALGERARKRK